MRARLVVVAAVVLALATFCRAQTPAGSAFTYQGVLDTTGIPPTSQVDLRVAAVRRADRRHAPVCAAPVHGCEPCAGTVQPRLGLRCRHVQRRRSLDRVPGSLPRRYGHMGHTFATPGDHAHALCDHCPQWARRSHRTSRPTGTDRTARAGRAGRIHRSRWPIRAKRGGWAAGSTGTGGIGGRRRCRGRGRRHGRAGCSGSSRSTGAARPGRGSGRRRRCGPGGRIAIYAQQRQRVLHRRQRRRRSDRVPPTYPLHVVTTGPRAAFFTANATSGGSFGVWGQTASTGGTGVVGYSSRDFRLASFSACRPSLRAAPAAAFSAGLLQPAAMSGVSGA